MLNDYISLWGILGGFALLLVIATTIHEVWYHFSRVRRLKTMIEKSLEKEGRK